MFVKQTLSDFFANKRVLDVGSGDINGNNRYLFDNCHYDGNDVIEANNVTVVSKTKDLPFVNHLFDTIISTECFEHDPEYAESFVKIHNMLKPGGLFCFTCASTDRPEHGTRRTSPGDSYGTIGNLDDMSDYYKNLTAQDVNDVIPFNQLFPPGTPITIMLPKICILLELKKALREAKQDPSLYKLTQTIMFFTLIQVAKFDRNWIILYKE